MSSVQQLLDDINLRYPNHPYTSTQLVYWMNRIQKEIFQNAPHEATPYYFTLVDGNNFYPLPSDCDADDIIKIVIETKVSSGEYDPLEYMEFNLDKTVGAEDRFYTTYNGNIYINPQPDSDDEGRKVYLYYNKKPAELSASSLNASPDLQEAYQDLLVFGAIRNIAQANEDVSLANNYTVEYNELLAKLKKEKFDKMPKYPSTKNVLPWRRNKRYARQDRLYDILPI